MSITFGYDCEDCIGMREHGCYCANMGATKPGGPSYSQPTAEAIARVISLSYGEDPDEFAPISRMCNADNSPVPCWEVYEEQALAILAEFSFCTDQTEPVERARSIAADAFDKSHGGRMAASQRMREGKADDHEMVQCALAAQKSTTPMTDSIIAFIANEARRYASHYEQGSDGRNTHTLFAEWIEKLSTENAKLRADLKSWEITMQRIAELDEHPIGQGLMRTQEIMRKTGALEAFLGQPPRYGINDLYFRNGIRCSEIEQRLAAALSALEER